MSTIRAKAAYRAVITVRCRQATTRRATQCIARRTDSQVRGEPGRARRHAFRATPRAQLEVHAQSVVAGDTTLGGQRSAALARTLTVAWFARIMAAM